VDTWVQILITFVSAVLASGGLWSYLTNRRDKKDAKTLMIKGLGHDRIMELGMSYIRRGSITKDEYENLNDYLYKPYQAMGGNGSAKRIMHEVDNLPIIDKG
jgi:hypothetical protein